MPRTSVWLACFRGMQVACHLLSGVLLACFFPLLEQNTRQRIVKYWSRKLLEIMNVGLDVHGSGHSAGMHGRMLVANHVSWLDVIALNAVAPACFAAKAEVRNWPLLGWLCQRVGTLFVRRDLKRDTLRINREISGLLKQGTCVALFPEGTSSDGELPGHFHSALLQGAIDVRAAIYPVALRFHDGAGRSNGDAAFIGDMSFIASLWKILRSPSLHVSLLYLPPISSTDKSRRVLASETRGAIHIALAAHSTNYSVCVSSAALAPRWKCAVAATQS